VAARILLLVVSDAIRGIEGWPAEGAMRLRGRQITRVALGAIVALGLASGASAVVLGQTDDFQGGTPAGWGTGPANPNPPSWVASGGPDGEGDGYLRVEANGGDGSGGNLVAFNTDQWAGDYLAAGVGAIRADLRNRGPEPLVVRLLLEGPGGGFHSLDAARLRPGRHWRSFTFRIDAAALAGGADARATLSGVTKLRILHAPTLAGVEPVESVLGIDNVTAESGDPCLAAELRGPALGLCRAYCNALACDGNSSRRACGVLARVFERRTGALPPCSFADADGDGVEDGVDNCPEQPNGDQLDADADGFGDACDNCPGDPNPGQEDTFGTAGVGDACDCPCFTTVDAIAIATDPECDPFCFVSPPAGLNLTGIQCSTARPDFSVVVEEFTDFGGEPLCQLNLPPPGESVLVVGMGESQVEACRAYVFEAAEATGLECR
jgi:hypothetical protein